MAEEPRTTSLTSAIEGECSTPARLRDRLLVQIDVATDRGTSSVLGTSAEIAELAQAAAALDQIAEPDGVLLPGSPALDVDKLTHELWNGLQEIQQERGSGPGYPTIISDHAVDVLHAALARQGFTDAMPLPELGPA